MMTTTKKKLKIVFQDSDLASEFCQCVSLLEPEASAKAKGKGNPETPVSLPAGFIVPSGGSSGREDRGYDRASPPYGSGSGSGPDSGARIWDVVFRCLAGSRRKKSGRVSVTTHDGSYVLRALRLGRIDRIRRNLNIGDGDDNGSLSSSDESEDDGSEPPFGEKGDKGASVPNDLRHWKVTDEFPLNNLSVVLRWDGVSVDIFKKVGMMTTTEKKLKIIFQDSDLASEFCQCVSSPKSSFLTDWARTLSGVPSPDKVLEEGRDDVQVLVDIVSCWDLPEPGSVSSSVNTSKFGANKRYIIARIGGVEVHRTKPLSGIYENLIFTVKTDSLFLLSLPPIALFSEILERDERNENEEDEGLTLEVMETNAFRRDDSLGGAKVLLETLYKSKGERIEYDLKLSATKRGHWNENVGTIVLRCRRATQRDRDVLSALREGHSISVDDGTGGRVPGVRKQAKFNLRRTSKNVHDNQGNKVKKYRVRPKPDPRQKRATKWLTDAQIQEGAMKASNRWLETGTGNLGRVFLEVIGCDGLPVSDFFQQTDALVCVVFEDSAVMTDVIFNCPSPRWLPWSKRAFIFRRFDSRSQIFLSVSDYDVGKDVHNNIIGRAVIDLLSLRPATEYLLHYNLFDNSEVIGEKKRRDSVTVRIFIEVQDERRLVLSALVPPSSIFVATKKQKDFRVIHYACSGKEGNSNEFDMKLINAYIEELMGYCHFVVYYIREGFINVLLWRGHFPLRIPVPKCKSGQDDARVRWWTLCLLPLHSVAAFVSGVVLVERPHFLPSFVIALIAWVLTASLEFRDKDPSPWRGNKPFYEVAWNLVTNKPLPSPPIAANENKEESELFRRNWKNRYSMFEMESKIKYQKSLKLKEDYLKEFNLVGRADISGSTESEGMQGPFRQLKLLWCQVLEVLETILFWVRFIRNVVLWEQYYLAFFACISCYVLAVLFLFVPFKFLIYWCMRILIWIFLGPWMKIVDFFWDSKIKPAIEIMRKEAVEQGFESSIKLRRIKKENATKEKEFKQLMFGRYITKVPIIKAEKHHQFPLPHSTARPIKKPEQHTREAMKNSKRVLGQYLVGELIPHQFTDTLSSPADEKTFELKVKEGDDYKPPSEFDPLLS